MTRPEQSVLDTIAELEAEENPDDITELVRRQLEQGLERGDGPERSLGEEIMAEFLVDLRSLGAFSERMRQLGFMPMPGGVSAGWRAAILP